jgi:Domain of unknown function (DUF5753)
MRREAHTIRTWQPIIIPGPLQTPEYARVLFEVMGTPDDLVEDLVAARIELQQQTIERESTPAKLIAVMDEAVLYRSVGPAEVMHRQLLHLAGQSQRKHIGIQVIPTSRANGVFLSTSRRSSWAVSRCGDLVFRRRQQPSPGRRRHRRSRGQTATTHPHQPRTATRTIGFPVAAGTTEWGAEA